ncbi:hypothetical protein A3J90_06180 [candidate division WOR-1 bacterium RIFOXYC2_FULL_37_10]|uniref:Peptidase M15A C-terminal domain-containing protein n=1 Tax=candidate division WOR-1 bacterium RIFOXYB2_FULL_37_13 TaxID=1802579 RepID=A0A1F4SWB2_UNCSA|nr:MAG: hypothetical protein A2246_00400 [candidate division WOR-1 bacterium RIFOXYA2_FULL_37_7]OGC24721.1 MAG: hypothetical protein A2310_04470 [candidate division WOR-1 bacterium RIFOXYB2_FULL_37_13]OGC34818.1 MAG: hypothetical protein A3J90_06180 [candidate division WOR-1 bacterium RIFOXYC2_FULL_37_10]
MKKLSDHFFEEDFRCKCNVCKREDFRLHLGLVGILEMIAEHFKKQVKIFSAYWCDQYYESLKKNHRSYHPMGKAVHIAIDGVDIKELFKYAETIPGINGIGFYPKNNFIHIDTRPEDKKEAWIKEGESYFPLSADKRRQYGL